MKPTYAFAVLSGLLLAACGAKSEPGKRYTMQGKILAVDEKAQTATIQHGKIGDWMEAMTMEFPVHDPAEFKKLQPGMKITATVYVTEDSYWIGNIHPVQ